MPATNDAVNELARAFNKLCRLAETVRRLPADTFERRTAWHALRDAREAAHRAIAAFDREFGVAPPDWAEPLLDLMPSVLDGGD